MRIPITKRLMACADLVDRGARVADIGCDHGYLGIYLLREKIASFVIASDLRPLPLASAQKNAKRYGAENISFVCADGLEGVDPEAVDTIVCAGMGGDLILMLLEQSPWATEGKYTLILQPQSAQHEVRMRLMEKGFVITREEPVLDAGHVYTAMKWIYGGKAAVCDPLHAFVSDALLRSGSSHLPAYLDATIRRLEQATENMKQAKETPEKLAFFETALQGVREVRKQYDHSS